MYGLWEREMGRIGDFAGSVKICGQNTHDSGISTWKKIKHNAVDAIFQNVSSYLLLMNACTFD